MPITLDGYTITLTPEVGGKGSSEENPYSFYDIYQESVACGWSPVIEYHYGRYTKSYYIPYKISLEGVWFVDKNFSVVVNNRSATDRDGFVSDYLSHIKFHNIYAGYLLVDQPFNNRMTLYNADIKNMQLSAYAGISFKDNVDLENVNLLNVGSLYFGSLGYDINLKNIDIINTTYGVIPQYSMNVENIRTIGCRYGVLAGYNRVPVKMYNVDVQEVETDSIRIIALHNDNAPLTLVDSKIDISTIYVQQNTAGRQTTLILASTFSSKVIGSNGGTITIYDKDDNILYSEILGSDEMTPQEIPYYHRYLQYGATAEENTDIITTYEPYRCVIQKAGYDDLIIPNIVVIPGQPINIRGELVSVTPPVYYKDDLTTEITSALKVDLIEEPTLTVEIN